MSPSHRFASTTNSSGVAAELTATNSLDSAWNSRGRVWLLWASSLNTEFKKQSHKQFIKSSERFCSNAVVTCSFLSSVILQQFSYCVVFLLYKLCILEMYRIYFYTCSCEVSTEGQIPKSNQSFSVCGVSAQVTSYKRQILQEWNHNWKIFYGNKTYEWKLVAVCWQCPHSPRRRIQDSW